MFRRPGLIITVICGLLLQVISIGSATGATPVITIRPRPAWINVITLSNKKLPSREVTDGYFTQLLEEQIHVESKAVYRRIIREIVSGAGIQNGSQISISFQPAYEQLTLHNVIVWRSGRAQHRLDKTSFKVVADEKDLSRFIYQGSFSAFCILNDIRKGDRIEFSYTITGRNPIFGDNYTDDLYFQGSAPYAQMYRSVFVSTRRKLHFKSFNKAPASQKSVKNGLNCYEWNITQVLAPPYADNEPGWFNNYNHIQISDYDSWQQVTNWALTVNPIAKYLKGQLAERVTRLKAAAGDNKEQYFRSAVQMVQDEVRYMGIELGEYSHRANSPEKVYSQRYGDCKDKSLLLASILEANGIEAHMVLINTAAKGRVDEFIPSPTVFDHACVAAVVSGKQVYVDATIAYQRGEGADLYFPDYGKGLVIKSGNTGFTAIPPGKAGKITITELFNIPDEKGKVDLDVTSVYTLHEADQIRDKLASGSMAETEKSYLDYYAKIYPKIEKAADSLIVKDNPAKNELTTIEHYRIAGFFKQKEPGRYTSSFYADYINNQLPAIPARATLPVSVNYPENIDYTIKVVLKNGWDVEKTNTRVQGDTYVFVSATSALGDTLMLNYKLKYLKDFIAVDQLDKARDDLKQISDNELSYSFTITPDKTLVPFNLNAWLLGFLITVSALLALIGIKIYRTETRGLLFEHGASFTPIGGWLIIVAIGLALSPFGIAYKIINGAYLDMHTWAEHVSTVNDIAYKGLIIGIATGDVVLLCYACFCFILLMNRRDILPQHITGFYAFAMAFAVLVYIAKICISYDIKESETTAMARTILYGIIWIAYFKKSERVEQTFIVPYPAHNYSYEDAN